MRVLLATDFSEHASVAAQLVRDLALPTSSIVRVIHVIEPVTTVGVFAPNAIVMINEAAERQAREQAVRVAKEVARPGVEAAGVIGFGRAADVILAEAEDVKPDIIVIGNRGRGGIRSALLGSVSAEIVDRAPCPVLVARVPRVSSVILAEDGSAFASAGARVIRDIPALAALPIRVVSVVDAPFPMLPYDPTATAVAVNAYREYEEGLVTMRASHAGYARDRAGSLKDAGIAATWEQREGDAAAQLIEAAQQLGADLIVIGSRGQTGLTRLALGSVARSVLFHAPMSVLVVHPTKAALARSPDGKAPNAVVAKA
jgi:nucleotide-binding universal stress UspA family protein